MYYLELYFSNGQARIDRLNKFLYMSDNIMKIINLHKTDHQIY